MLRFCPDVLLVLASEALPEGGDLSYGPTVDSLPYRGRLSLVRSQTPGVLALCGHFSRQNCPNSSLAVLWAKWLADR